MTHASRHPAPLQRPSVAAGRTLLTGAAGAWPGRRLGHAVALLLCASGLAACSTLSDTDALISLHDQATSLQKPSSPPAGVNLMADLQSAR